MKAELKVIDAFPTPIGIVNLGEELIPLNELLISDIEKERSKSKSNMGTFNGNDASWLSEYGLEKKYSSFETLQECIVSAVIPTLMKVGYSRDYIDNKVRIDNLWANVIFKPGGWAQPHIHGTGDDLFTGVYYPKGAKNTKLHEVLKATSITVQAEGALVLSDPAKNVKKQVRSKDFTEPQSYPYFGANIYVEPTESLLILFPSWLEHHVTPSMSDSIRYSISFSIHKV